jgi:hypothetical protein
LASAYGLSSNRVLSAKTLMTCKTSIGETNPSPLTSGRTSRATFAGVAVAVATARSAANKRRDCSVSTRKRRLRDRRESVRAAIKERMANVIPPDQGASVRILGSD